ncbi:hypothetical protein [Nocardioides sp. SYSU DS0663]|uniref:hypothetical protein n=1 Tax=Nocardioides sp. SYSU DS0663 TaxID=3416445 RepID=UPI003F4C92F5
MTRRLAVLLCCLLALAGCAGTDRPSNAEPSPDPTSSAAVERPRELADLPRGRPVDLPYALGRRLVIGARSVVLAARPWRLLDTPTTVVVLTRDNVLLAVDKDDPAQRTVLSRAAWSPVVDAAGGLLAWQEPTTPRPRVVAARLGSSGPRVVGRTFFPARPTCCDNPFHVVGISERGEVLGSLPGLARSWVWRPGREAPHRGPVRLRGLAGGVLLDHPRTFEHSGTRAEVEQQAVVAS